MALFLLQRMNNLQTVAFEARAYYPAANWNGSKEILKGVENQKEAEYRDPDFVEAAAGLK